MRNRKDLLLSCLAMVWLAAGLAMVEGAPLPYPVVDTGQDHCYDDTRSIPSPPPDAPFHGQDAQYQGAPPSYRVNDDGTVTDRTTGLTWTRDPGEKVTYAQAVAGARACRVGGHADWRLPSVKELYSLIDFRGTDPSGYRGRDTSRLRPFLDPKIFVFRYGREEEGDRIIDSQFATSTVYRSTTMNGSATMFGVNFADGRIKGYPTGSRPGRGEKRFHALYVRGNPAYGKNRFVDQGDGTIADTATGLVWQQADSGRGLDWEEALAYAEALTLAGQDDWRLPNAKELQSIVDYARCPDATGSPAIDPLFRCSAIRNEAGQPDFPCYWTGTSHASSAGGANAAVYVAFGRAMGNMRGRWLDVHGAGAQRSDPKTGDPARFPRGRGPQGDALRIYNHVRCVRGGLAAADSGGADRDGRPGPAPAP